MGSTRTSNRRGWLYPKCAAVFGQNVLARSRKICVRVNSEHAGQNKRQNIWLDKEGFVSPKILTQFNILPQVLALLGWLMGGKDYEPHQTGMSAKISMADHEKWKQGLRNGHTKMNLLLKIIIITYQGLWVFLKWVERMSCLLSDKECVHKGRH